MADLNSSNKKWASMSDSQKKDIQDALSRVRGGSSNETPQQALQRINSQGYYTPKSAFEMSTNPYTGETYDRSETLRNYLTSAAQAQRDYETSARQLAMNNYVRNLNQGRNAYNAVQNILQQNEERKNREAAIQRLLSTLPQSEISSGNRANAVTEVLAKADNARNGLSYGLTKGLGYNSLVNAIGSAYENATGEVQPSLRAFNEETERAQRNAPNAFSAGNIAGNIALMGGVGSAAGAGLNALGATGRAARLAANALTFGGTEAIHGLGDVAQGNISPGRYAKNIGTSALGGVVGGEASNLVGTRMANLLLKKGMMTPFMEFVRQTASGTAFGAGNLAATQAVAYGTNDDEMKLNRRQAAEQLATTFGFSMINGAIRTLNATAAAKSALQSQVDQATAVYEQLTNGTFSEEEYIQRINTLMEFTDDLRKSINSQYLAGNQVAVNNMNDALDVIQESLRGKLSGIDAARAAGNVGNNILVDSIDAGTDGTTDIVPPVTEPPAPTNMPPEPTAGSPAIEPAVLAAAGAVAPQSIAPVSVDAQLLDLAQRNEDIKAAQRQALYEAGKNQEQNIQPIMDNATMLSDEEKIDAIRKGNADAAKAEIEAIRSENKVQTAQDEVENGLVETTRNEPIKSEPEITKASVTNNQNEALQKGSENEQQNNLDHAEQSGTIEAGGKSKYVTKPKDIITSANKIFRESKKARGGAPDAAIIADDGRQYITDGASAVVFNEAVDGIPVVKETGTWKIPESNNTFINAINKAIKNSNSQPGSIEIDYHDVHGAIKELAKSKMLDLSGLKVFSFDNKKLIDFGKEAQLVSAERLETAIRMLDNPVVYYGGGDKQPIYIKGDNGEAIVFPLRNESVKKFLYPNNSQEDKNVTVSRTVDGAGNGNGPSERVVVPVGRGPETSDSGRAGEERPVTVGSMESDGNIEPAVSGLQSGRNESPVKSGPGRTGVRTEGERVVLPGPRGEILEKGSGNDRGETIPRDLAVDREQHAGGNLESDLSPQAQAEVNEGVPKSAATTVSERPANTQAEVEASRAADIQPKGTNFVIPQEGLKLPNGEKARYKANIAAIKTLRSLMADNRQATPEEQAVLSKYVGWGGLKNAFSEKDQNWAKENKELKSLLTEDEYKAARGSVLNAHYTEVGVIRAMYNGLKGMGFKGGRILEPAAGIGHFVGAMPSDVNVQSLTMVELDNITGNIAKYLYPNADVRVQGFETAILPDNYMDLAISNVPFGNYGVFDKSYPKAITGAIHNYFFAKSLDKVRPGGLVCFITSRYTMDARDSTIRDYIMQRADLVGAIRLPDTAFKGNAGTDVVADILVLKKREPGTAYNGEAFSKTGYYHGNLNIYDQTNEYFQNHPEMVLGEASSTGTMYGSNSLTYKPKPGSLDKQIEKAFSKIKATMDYPVVQSQADTFRQNRNEMRKAESKTKNGTYVKKDGKIYKNDNGVLVDTDLNAKSAAIVSASIDMRDVARQLLAVQMNNGSQSEIDQLRKKLNIEYDSFVKKYGPINSVSNRRAISGDSDSPFILALENYNAETKTAVKADIFTKNTVSPRKVVEHVDNMADGLAASINDSGSVDIPLIARVTGKSEEHTTRELIDQKLVFKTKDGTLQSAQQYLSGNVRAKLKEARALVTMDPDFKNNIEELEKVVPKDIEPADISVKPGATWVPPDLYADFAAEMLGTSNRGWRKAIEVTYVPAAGAYKVAYGPGGRYVKGNSYDVSEYGTEDKSFVQIFEAALNNKELKVYFPHGKDEKAVLNTKSTIAVKEKKNKIIQKFQEWMWSDDERVKTYAPLYNDMFNNSAVPNYDGSKLEINGLSIKYSLREHQANAVQRIIMSGGNTLLAHGTGSGKSLEMAAAAMKLRQIGAIKKPMFVVPKNLLGQWGNEFYSYFPNAKLLFPADNDFTPGNRKAFTNKIATGDWDAVILSYEQFGMIPMSPEAQKRFFQNQIDDIIAAQEAARATEGKKGFTVSALEKKRKSLQTKLQELDSIRRDEDNIDFESLGVDSLFVDEAHNFKNLLYNTQLQNVGDLGNQNGSKRSFDLYTKVKYLQGLNGGRGVVFGTATPVMNSVVEMYTMQRYLQGDLLEQKGISNFDAWVNEFGDVQEIQKMKSDGAGYETRTSLARYRNLGELQQMFRGFADVVINPPGLADKLPKLRTGSTIVVECEPTDVQREYLKELGKRSEAVRHSRDLKEDNILKIYSDGKKMSYTQRMIDSSLPYEEGGKIAKCVDNVLKEYKASKSIKGTQLVFCDTGVIGSNAKEPLPLWQDIKNMLIAGGIPEKEIAFAQSGMSDKQKELMQKKMNDGDTRVLIGSTKTMGTGLNIQKRCYAMHEINAPDRPGDVEQNRGRIVRQGNMNKEVAIYTYITKETFDSRQWDNLKRKGAFIHQAMAGDVAGRTVDGDGDFAMSAAEISALASGNPLIIEQNEVSTKIGKLEALESEHTKQVSAANRKIAELPRIIGQLQENIKNYEYDAAHAPDLSGDKFAVKIGGRSYVKRVDAGEAIIAEAKKLFSINDELSTKRIGTVGDYDLMVSNHADGFVMGKAQYPFAVNMESADGTIKSLTNATNAAKVKLENAKANLEKYQDELVRYQEISKQKFEYADELSKLRAREAEIMETLNPSEERVLYSEAGEAEEPAVSNRRVSNTSIANNTDNWTAKRVGDTEKKPMPLSDIISKIEHDFGINVTEGYVRGAGTTGQFNARDNGIRTKIANDLPTVAHELGHWFDKKYQISNGNLSNDIKNELKNALGDSKDLYPSKRHVPEGMAEYIRQYLQNREVAAIDYPKFTDHFLKNLDPEDLLRLNTFADEINAYYSLDTDTAASSIRLREEGGRDFRTYGERIRDMGDSMYQAWMDSNYSIKQYDRATGSKAYTLATNAAYSDAIAGRVISSDLTDPNGQYVGPGLKAALNGISTTNKTEYKAFNEYLVCIHGQEWLDQGMRVFADDRKNSSQWMQNRAEALEAQYPEFKAAGERVIDFVNRFTKVWGVDTGLISPELRKTLEEKYPNYVPFNRAIEKGRRGNAARKGFANQNSPVKRAKGSGLDVIAPVDNIIDMVVTYVNTSVRNNVALEMRRSALEHGDATFMEKIPEPKVPKTFDLTGLKESLTNDVFESALNGKIDETGLAAMQSMIDSISDVLTQYSRGKAGGDVITIMVDGEPEFWKVNDPMLLESLTSLNGSKISGILDAYAVTTRFMTSMITGSNPIWSIFSNAPRDIQTLAVYAKDKTPKGYVNLARNIAEAYLNGFNENYRDGKSLDPLYSEYLAMGGGHASAYSADRDLAKKFRKDFTKTKTQQRLEMLNPLEAVSFISDTIERGPRYATYKACRTNGMDPQEAFFEAMDVTINFRKSGTYSRQVNKAVPFFNANIQGTDKFYRFFSAEDVSKPNRAKASATRLLMWFAACAGIAGIDYALNHSDEKATKEYQRLSNYTKNSFFCIPLGDGKYFTIPKGRELLLPASLFERAIELTKGNRQAFNEFYEYAADNMLPSIFSDIAQYPVNAVTMGGEASFDELLSGTLGSLGAIGILSNMHANKDFLGRPIESVALSYYDPARRYNNNTSKLAKAIGEKFGWSPVMIDYFGNNFLSYPWKLQKALFPMSSSERDLTLGVSNTYLKDNVYSQDLVNWLYDKADKSSHIAKDSDDIEKKITAKMDGNMTTFYSRFYKLNKNSEGIESRKSRQAVLNMIQGYRDIEDLGNPEETERIYNIVKAANDVSLLPAVMQPYVKDGDEQYNLTDAQYVAFQEKYNGYYWNYANESIDLNAPMNEQIAALKSVAKIAKQNAISDMLERVSGYTASGIDALSSEARIGFDQKIASASADGSLTKREIVGTALEMLSEGVSSDEAYELYISKSKKDKNAIAWEDAGYSFDKYLEGASAMMAAQEIKDPDKKRETVVEYLDNYSAGTTPNGAKSEKEILWELAGYQNSTYEKYNGSDNKPQKEEISSNKPEPQPENVKSALAPTPTPLSNTENKTENKKASKNAAAEIDKELAEQSIEYDARYAYVVDQVTSKNRTAQEAVDWYLSDSSRASAVKYTAWKDAGGSDYDYLKTRADLTKFSGKGKQEKIANYIKKQNMSEAKERVIWFDICDYSEKNWNKYF